MQMTECDNCRKRGPVPPEGWLLLAQIEAVSHQLLAALTQAGTDLRGTFCSWQCVAEYAAVRALVPSTEDGEVP